MDEGMSVDQLGEILLDYSKEEAKKKAQLVTFVWFLAVELGISEERISQLYNRAEQES